MVLWIVLAAFVLPLAYLCWDLVEERGARRNKLARLRRRIEEREAAAGTLADREGADRE